MKKALMALTCTGVLLVAGCSAPAPAPAQAGSTAAATTPAAPATPKRAPGSEVDKATLAAELDAAAKNLTSMHMDMQSKTSAAGMTIDIGMTGDLDVTNRETPKGKISMTGFVPMDMVMDGTDVVYMKTPMLGEGWFKATHAELGADVPDAAEQTNLYKDFLGKADKVTYIGEETVEGEKTDRYTLMVPTKDLADGAGGDTPAPVELYVNQQGWVKKMQVNLTDPVNMSLDMVMSKFNEPITLEIPTDAQPIPKR